MKKYIALIAVILCITAVSGCDNGGNVPAQTTVTNTSAQTTVTNTSAAEEVHEVTEYAFKAPEEVDTTEEALAYLDEVAPLYRKYLDLRRTVPLSLEVTITTKEGKYRSAIYIKDKKNFATYSMDPLGNKTTVVYMDNKGYMIDEERKVVYCAEYNDKIFGETFEEYNLTKIKADAVKNADYLCETLSYNGTEYNAITITSGGQTSVNYLDKTTGKLAYTVTDTGETKVDLFENSLTNPHVFEIPAEYEFKTIEDYIMEQRENEDETQTQ